MAGVVNFLKSAYDEFKKVQWPQRKETFRLTAYVIGASLGVGLFVSAFDYIFTEMLQVLIGG